MITIQSAMLVALGFLVAALITLFVAPAYRRRAVRLTTDAIRRSMPLTEAEIRADKDKLRAEYAITVHRLETKVQEGALVAARQMVELNRRDAAISNLEGEVMRMRTSLEEHENARRVLEQTVTDRLPKVESRLGEAKKMLFHRDREISTLTQSADKQSKALDEMTQITTQQRDEIHRLNAALAARAARNRESIGDTRFDGEVALRSEIEALREKNRDQAAHITPTVRVSSPAAAACRPARLRGTRISTVSTSWRSPRQPQLTGNCSGFARPSTKPRRRCAPHSRTRAMAPMPHLSSSCALPRPRPRIRLPKSRA